MFEKTILRSADVCSILNVSLPTLYRWVREKRFPAGVRYGTKIVGWTRETVEGWIAEKQRAASSK